MADAGGWSTPRRANPLGRIALTLSIMGLICIWGAIPFADAIGAELLGTVVCVAGWILMPVAFAIGCAGLVWSGRGRAASAAALVVSTIGSVGSFILLLTGLMLVKVWHFLPN